MLSPFYRTPHTACGGAPSHAHISRRISTHSPREFRKSSQRAPPKHNHRNMTIYLHFSPALVRQVRPFGLALLAETTTTNNQSQAPKPPVYMLAIANFSTRSVKCMYILLFDQQSETNRYGDEANLKIAWNIQVYVYVYFFGLGFMVVAWPRKAVAESRQSRVLRKVFDERRIKSTFA